MSKIKNARYQRANQDECEVFLNGGMTEKAFDFSSINDYRSIHKFSSPHSLHRDRHLALDSGKQVQARDFNYLQIIKWFKYIDFYFLFSNT